MRSTVSSKQQRTHGRAELHAQEAHSHQVAQARTERS